MWSFREVLTLSLKRLKFNFLETKVARSERSQRKKIFDFVHGPRNTTNDLCG
jgi:hypothetical protein